MITDSPNSNLNPSREKAVVELYRQATELRPSGKALLELLRDYSAGIKLLDIRVGAANHRPLCKAEEQYRGIHYSRR